MVFTSWWCLHNGCQFDRSQNRSASPRCGTTWSTTVAFTYRPSFWHSAHKGWVCRNCFLAFRQADPYPRPEAERTSSGWRALCFSQYFCPDGTRAGQPGCLHGMLGFDGTASSFPAHKKRASRNDPVTLIHFVSIRIPHLDTACQCKYRLNIVQLSRIGSSQDSIYSSSILSRALYSSFKAAIAVFL